MAQRSDVEPARQWTQRVGRAITYGPFARFADWWCAGRDARIALPGLLVPNPQGDSSQGPSSPRPATEPIPGRNATGGAGPADMAPGPAAGTSAAVWDTPRTVFLGQLGRGRAEKEWLRYQRAVAAYLIPLAQARADRDSARRQLRAAQDRLDGLQPPRGDELTTRRSGEQLTDEGVVTARRMRDFTERQQEARASARTLTDQVTTHETEVARLSEQVRIRFEVTKTRAELIDAYVRRRRAYYLARLLRKHPDAERIGLLVRGDWPERPSWTSWAVSPDLAVDEGRGTPTGSE